MSTLTTEDAEHEAADRATGFRYVLLLAERSPYVDETVTTEDVTGSVADLTTGLRPWLLAYLRTGHRENGWYTGHLVTTDEDGWYDTYLSLVVEDVLWYWDEECVPVSRLTRPAEPSAGSAPVRRPRLLDE